MQRNLSQVTFCCAFCLAIVVTMSLSLADAMGIWGQPQEDAPPLEEGALLPEGALAVEPPSSAEQPVAPHQMEPVSLEARDSY